MIKLTTPYLVSCLALLLPASATAQTDAFYAFECSTSFDTAQRAEELLGDTGINRVPSEGSLLAMEPVRVQDGVEADAIYAQLQLRLHQVVAELWPRRAEGLAVRTPEEAVILASLIASYGGVTSDWPYVSQVLHGRLSEGLKLQVDASVIYGIFGPDTSRHEALRASQLRDDNPYNLYLRDGLPPTPICNVSVAAIAAALSPAETDFRFIAATSFGVLRFAETLEEHNENILLLRQDQ